MSNKQQRFDRQQADQETARRRKLLTFSVLGAVVVLIGVSQFVFTRQSAATETGSLAKCDAVETVPDEGRGHLQPGQTVAYQSNPPTSGWHNPEPYPAGIYGNPLDPTKLVHSLEHGYIVIYYRNLVQDELATLTNIVRNNQYKVILDPYANNPARVVLTAWDHKQQCAGVNEQAIRQFIAAYREQAPESSSP